MMRRVPSSPRHQIETNRAPSSAHRQIDRDAKPEPERPGSVCGRAYACFALMDIAEDEDFLVEVPVDGIGVVDEVPQDLRVVCGGHDQCLLGPVVQDQQVRELAVLQRSLATPVGVDVRNLADPYRLLGVLPAQGDPPYVGSKGLATLTPYRA